MNSLVYHTFLRQSSGRTISLNSHVSKSIAENPPHLVLQSQLRSCKTSTEKDSNPWAVVTQLREPVTPCGPPLTPQHWTELPAELCQRRKHSNLTPLACRLCPAEEKGQDGDWQHPGPAHLFSQLCLRASSGSDPGVPGARAATVLKSLLATPCSALPPWQQHSPEEQGEHRQARGPPVVFPSWPSSSSTTCSLYSQAGQGAGSGERPEQPCGWGPGGCRAERAG